MAARRASSSAVWASTRDSAVRGVSGIAHRGTEGGGDFRHVADPLGEEDEVGGGVDRIAALKLGDVQQGGNGRGQGGVGGIKHGAYPFVNGGCRNSSGLVWYIAVGVTEPA